MLISKKNDFIKKGVNGNSIIDNINNLSNVDNINKLY